MLTRKAVYFLLVTSAYKDFASFLTAMLVSSAFALPLIFAHTGLISSPACWMSLIGGALVYGTILVFTGVFVRLPFLRAVAQKDQEVRIAHLPDIFSFAGPLRGRLLGAVPRTHKVIQQSHLMFRSLCLLLAYLCRSRWIEDRIENTVRHCIGV
jgi:hypothetical protein